MRYLLYFLFSIFNIFNCFSQNKTESIEYIYDKNEVYNSKTIINNAAFIPLEKTINNGLNNGVYWFKVSNISAESLTIQIPNNRISEATAYQENEPIITSKHERFLTFKSNNKANIYIKINAIREALIPIDVNTLEDFSKKEKDSFLFIGFYYGFAFVIVLINFFYFINFRDLTFLYYALFLFSVCLGFSISDGIYFFFNYSTSAINILEVFDHSLVALFGVLFASSFLQIDDYYPKSKKILFLLSGIIFCFGIFFVFTKNHLWYVVMESLVFVILSYYWLASCILFSKNLFVKIFAIAYFFILLLGLGFYINKLFGISIIVSATLLKFGAFFEMIILSFAVIYRMKTLQKENIVMRKEIISHVKKIKNLSVELQKNNTPQTPNLEEANLTSREKEILYAVIDGMTNKEIAEKLNISINTVKYHVKNIYDKLHIKSRSEIKKLIS